MARGGRTAAGVPRKRPGRELPSRSGLRWRDEYAGGAACDCQQLARRLPATAAARGSYPRTDVGASSAAGAATGVQLSSVAGGRPGDRASVVAQTTPGASCSISYRTPVGTSSTAQGLTPKTADGNGAVSWTWEIGPSTRPGTGAVVVTCNGASARSSIQIG